MTGEEPLRLGNVVLDLSRGCVRDSGGAEIALRPKALDLLLMLARHRGRVLSRDELFDAVWPNVTVTEDSIAQCVREIRRAIGDPEGRLLRTIVKRGYCLDVVVEPITLPDRAPVRGKDDLPSLAVLPFQNNSSDPAPNGSRTGLWRKSRRPCRASVPCS